MRWWILKSEPAEFAYADLEAAPNRATQWTGVRNYEARNLIRDRMRPGDRGFFYHSSCAEPAIVGLVRIGSTAYPDPTADITPATRWYAIDVSADRALRRPLLRTDLAALAELRGHRLLARGNRLSILEVDAPAARAILALERRPPPSS